MNGAPPMPPLPAGWATAQDPNSGKTYFYNSATGATGWSREEAGGATEELPDGISSGFDESSGYTYYYNANTGVTGWSLEEVTPAEAAPEPEEEPVPVPVDPEPVEPVGHPSSMTVSQSLSTPSQASYA